MEETAAEVHLYDRVIVGHLAIAHLIFNIFNSHLDVVIHNWQGDTEDEEGYTAEMCSVLVRMLTELNTRQSNNRPKRYLYGGNELQNSLSRLQIDRCCRRLTRSAPHEGEWKGAFFASLSHSFALECRPCSSR